jgi:hypothetical protein
MELRQFTNAYYTSKAGCVHSSQPHSWQTDEKARAGARGTLSRITGSQSLEPFDVNVDVVDGVVIGGDNVDDSDSVTSSEKHRCVLSVLSRWHS